MTKYSTNTYYVFDKLFYIMFIIGLISYFAYTFNDSEEILKGSIFLISILLIIFLIKISKLASIEFTDKYIRAKYIIPPRLKKMNYSDIETYEHVSGYKRTSVDIIRFKSGGINPLKFKITSIVPDDEFMEFVKWMKSINDKIEFKFYPSDSKLNNLYKSKLN